MAQSLNILHSLLDFLSSGYTKDALFGKFCSALERTGYLPLPDGTNDQRLKKAIQLFHGALIEMEKSGRKKFSLKYLAETLKSQGNQAMQSKLYTKAIELYDCAIALCRNNAVYYCNRAAAYTEIHKYDDAVRDCLQSIKLDPKYSKAYNRLGLAYSAVGNYFEAINKGYRKALQLDPNNEAVKQNIRVAALKLVEQLQGSGSHQATNSFSFNTSEGSSSFCTSTTTINSSSSFSTSYGSPSLSSFCTRDSAFSFSTSAGSFSFSTRNGSTSEQFSFSTSNGSTSEHYGYSAGMPDSKHQSKSTTGSESKGAPPPFGSKNITMNSKGIFITDGNSKSISMTSEGISIIS